MPITINTSRHQLLSNTQEVTSSTGETKQNDHAISNNAQHASSQSSQHNTYGASVIGINGARAQWSMQDNLKPPHEVKPDELDFTIGRCLGSGGQAKVHILVDQYAREFAGKFFFEPKNLEKEYKNYTNIGTHPNIAQCYGKKEVDGKEYLVMEKIQGHTLGKVMQNLDSYCRTAFPEETQYVPALRLMLTEQLMDALNFLGAKGISHADLKPANILISTDAQLKLIDFGLSKTHQEDPRAQGSIHYLAPEAIVRNQKDYPKIDGYAAGNLTLGLLTGYYVMQGGNLSYHAEPSDFNRDMEILAGGRNFLAGHEPLEKLPQLTSSGSFFELSGFNKERELSFSNHQDINKMLDEKVVQPLLRANPNNRAEIKSVHQAIKEGVNEYLSQDVRKRAIALLQQVNHSPTEECMEENHDNVESLVLGTVPPRPPKSKQSATLQSTLEEGRLELEKLAVGKLELQQKLDRRTLERLLQEKQKNKSLVQPAPPSVAKTETASIKTSTANKKKTLLLAD